MVIVLLQIFAASAKAFTIHGIVSDREAKEPLIGVAILVEGTQTGTTTDFEGNYSISLPRGQYTLLYTYVGYSPLRQSLFVEADTRLDITLASEAEILSEVEVQGRLRTNNETSLAIRSQQALQVTSGVSAQQIERAQDKDASEVIRRIPGISIIDEKFVMVRGLSQRYNNVWINSGSVPSSEADSRAFSFDMIPSSQIENMLIVKSPSPEYPADYSGGFILITTKESPEKNCLGVSFSGSINTIAHSQPFLRSAEGQWAPDYRRPLADWGAGMHGNYVCQIRGYRLSLLTNANYSTTHKTFLGMTNSLFGAYDIANDRSNYLRQATDNQYTFSSRVGAMVNVSLLSPLGKNRYEFKHIVNRINQQRYTDRIGISAQADHEQSGEFNHSNRTTYSGQISGYHTPAKQVKIDWTGGYSYAGRSLPDRRRYLYNDKLEMGVMALTSGNDVQRETTQLDEHIFSLIANYKQDISTQNYSFTIHSGLLGEYRTRTYRAHNYYLNWNYANNTLPEGFRMLPIDELMTSNYMGEDKLYESEEIKWRNNYDANNLLTSAYVAMNLPLGGYVSLYTGLRYEYSNMALISHTRDYESSPNTRHYQAHDWFPSANFTFRLTSKHQFRLGYGKSVNRPEFRERASSVFYDFELASDVQGNTELQNCYVHNVDLRYEWYPQAGEQISIAGFYKHFLNPIEWTYTVAGGTNMIYSYMNAEAAMSAGIELDVRKSLDFIGAKGLSLNANLSYIYSRVLFAEGSREKDRPMQGQSPYIINIGLFYSPVSEKPMLSSLQLGVLYNRIGKRLIGVGRSVGTVGSADVVNIPDSYEMPRNAIDLTLGWTPWRTLRFTFSLRDLLGEAVCYKQFGDVTLPDKSVKHIEETTKQYKPGQKFALGISYTF